MVMTAAPAPTGSRGPAKLQQLPGLDGLRAIAVVAVIVYHLNPSWLPGGFLGVDIFFVISGYLITALLMAEWSRSSAIDLGAFWKRRARRLLAAVLALLLIVTLAAAVVARDSLHGLQGDLPAALAYVMNWHLLVQHQPYLATFGRSPLLLHLWSLSVEEQFYLLWPLALIPLLRRLPASRIAGLAMVGALASATLRGVFFHAGNPSGVYFGTETHADGLLIGCALAAAIPPWRMMTSVPASARRLLERAGAGALALVLLGLATLGFNSSVTYRGGMLLVNLAAAVVVATAAHPAARIGPLLARQPLRWIGLRSYSLYLWHWPIFEMTRPGVDLHISAWQVQLLRLGLTALAAELSYRYVEQPWRTGRAQAALRNWMIRARPAVQVTAWAIPAVALSTVLASAPAVNGPPVLLQGSTEAARLAPGQAGLLSAPGTTSTTVAPDPVLANLMAGPLIQSVDAHQAATKRAAASARRSRSRPAPGVEEPILAVGDSVLLAASPALSQTFGPQITIDAAVGRQVSTGLQRLAQYRSAGALLRYKTVVVDLGTNGVFSPAQFAQLAQLVKGVPRVVIFNVHADRPWATVSNATLAAGVAGDPRQMRLVDWNRIAQTPMLYADGIHPDASGAGVYATLLLSAIRNSAR